MDKTVRGEAVTLPTCCTDMDIDLLDLVFPERLSEAGAEFIYAHGISMLTLNEIWHNSTYLGDGKIKLRHRCQMLGSDGQCRIYLTRPTICRQFDCKLRSDCGYQGCGAVNSNSRPQ